MKKHIARLGVISLLVTGTAAVGGSATATDQESTPQICVPIEATYETVENPDYVPAVPDEITNETTEWVTEAPDGDGWFVIDEREREVEPAVEQVEKHQYRRWIETTYKTVPNPDYVPAVPETPEVSHTEYLYEKPVYTTEHQWQKQTRTKVRHGKKGDWKVVSDWSYWSPAQVRWSDGGSGDHADWTEWHVDGFLGLESHTDYFDRDYRYVKNGVTREVQTGTKSSGWTKDTLGAPWVLVDEKTVVTQEYVPGTPAQGEETIEVVDVEGHYDYQWFDTKEDRDGWEFVLTKVKVEGKPAVTVTEYRFFREVVIPGTPAVGEPTIEVLVDEGRECPPLPEPDVYEFEDSEITCETAWFYSARYVTPFVWDAEAWEYVLADEPSDVIEASSERAPTPEEIEAEGLDCEQEPTPVPSEEPEPEPTDEPEVTPVADDDTPEAEKPQAQEARVLAYTGPGQASAALVVALALVLSGAALIVARVRRQAA